jgi:hypothetical protein
MEAKGSSGTSPKKKRASAGASRSKTAATKLAISFESPLAGEVRRAAEVQTDGNVSAWLAEAARAQLRQMHGRALLAELLAETGPIPQEIRDEVRRRWPR